MSKDGATLHGIEHFSATERAMTCADIDSQLAGIREETDKIEQVIHGRRGDNQAAVYFGGFFFPAYLAANDNAEEMKALDGHQKRKDRFIALKSAKHCPATLNNE